MSVRPAERQDRDRVAALRRAWVEENAGGAIDDPGFADEFELWWARELDQRLTWLAQVDGRPVGMLNMLVFTRMPRPGHPDPPSRWGYVANVFVLAEHRNEGLGRELVDACTSYADRERFARLVLSPSERSVPLYERAGFGSVTNLLVRPGEATGPNPAPPVPT